ncbi:MAG: hypothetical protein WC467_04275 [Patescibacteria group bacterium]
MNDTETSEITEKPCLDPALLVRLNEMIENRIINNERLLALLNSLEKGGKRRLKKELKKNITVSENARGYLVESVSAITYDESGKVWGTWPEKEKNLPRCTDLPANSILASAKYNFRQVCLRGLSVAAMAEKFPNHKWENHVKDKLPNQAGFYLISLENPLKNLNPAAENESFPADCYRLDFNLTIELLLTLQKLNQPVPSLFFRTTHINGHSDEVCVGLVDGKISFLSEDKVRAEKKMGICLVKSEKWM